MLCEPREMDEQPEEPGFVFDLDWDREPRYRCDVNFFVALSIMLWIVLTIRCLTLSDLPK
jgi:hypothetical protein